MKAGSIQIDRGMFHVSCEPHVAIKLCRVFGGVRRRKAGVFEMSATPGHAFELDWFRKMHPLDIAADSERAFRKLIATEKRKLASIAEIEADGYVPRDFELALPPREYQRFAADMLLRTRNLVLADDVGVGKSCSAIAAMTAPGVLPVLVVAPTHLPPQWEAEIRRFAPSLTIHRLRSGQPYELGKKRFVEYDENGKRCLVTTPKNPDVIITNYHKLVGWVETLASKVSMVVFDEIQELRHSGTNKYIAAKSIADACDVRLGMSASPVYNYGGEIYAVTDVIAPGALGSFDEFCREWCGGVSYEEAKTRGIDARKVCVSDPAALGTYMREAGLMLRRTRKDVGRELPDMTVVRYVVEADAERIREATADVVELAQRMLDRIGTGLERMQWATEIDYRMRLATGMAKAPAVADLVRLLVESGERVLLFGYHHLVYDIWRASFSRENYEIPFAMYTGEENEKEKAESVRRFIAGEVKVLMMSLRAGIGLDGLQKVCSVVVNGELDWSPQVHHQGGGRVHRDGQEKKVVVYFAVATSGSDPVIEDVLGIKAAQSNGILNPSDPGDPLKVGVAEDHIRKLAAEIVARHARNGGKTNNSEEQQEDAA